MCMTKHKMEWKVVQASCCSVQFFQSLSFRENLKICWWLYLHFKL
uniref:Uncharacterized protein n=1 Tax=Anguilla anguilla TaxID=7936 RepID=A0A0E9SD82_ANGAN